MVLTRSSEETENEAWLTKDSWYLVQSNRDAFAATCERHNLAKAKIDLLGQTAVTADAIIEKVLWEPGVLCPLTIFTSVLSASQSMGLHDPPQIKN